MFTVHNRDVCSLISIAVFFCLLSPGTLPAQTGDIIIPERTAYIASLTTRPDSYENYRPKKNIQARRPSGQQKKRSSFIKIRKNTNIEPGKKNTVKKASRTHTVRPGDTLTGIARKTGTTVETLIACNKLKNKNAIKVGMSLKVPAAARTHLPPPVLKADPGKIAKSNNSPRFRWPVSSVINYHNDGRDGVKPIGIIITGKKGSPVLSSASGTVKKIGSMRGFGNYIVIAHKGRYSTVYANLDRISVASGDRVAAGNTIGRINSSNQKLHFQIDLEGKPENPLKYLPGNI